MNKFIAHLNKIREDEEMQKEFYVTSIGVRIEVILGIIIGEAVTIYLTMFLIYNLYILIFQSI